MVRQFAFFIPGPLPGLNDYTAEAHSQKGNKRHSIRTKLKKTWTDRVRLYVLAEANRTNSDSFKGPVFVSYLWMEPNRRRDPSNFLFGKKFIEDGMVKATLIGGDGWKHIAGIQDKWIVDKENPGVLVTVSEV